MCLLTFESGEFNLERLLESRVKLFMPHVSNDGEQKTYC